ncbi:MULTISPECIES: hypothetical protein [unclassified Arsenophonus]|uniref:hypothetical protein n=1 Tax=unclassified Arsenophonus TaxID=2627083 RepID=UPI00286738A7|nr:hypothetical protein [Arsenophonus sp.]MDR5611440.1 hypothetical protein [Arsenophonus sp.]MDR5615482.1 hypothetical protein [Arsenophonus sp.]
MSNNFTLLSKIFDISEQIELLQKISFSLSGEERDVLNALVLDKAIELKSLSLKVRDQIELTNDAHINSETINATNKACPEKQKKFANYFGTNKNKS